MGFGEESVVKKSNIIQFETSFSQLHSKTLKVRKYKK